jgi:hypothetical protein
MGLDNNRTSIVRSHTANFSKNHNQYSRDLLRGAIGNEPDFENGRDDGEAYQPKHIEPYINNELERIQDSITNNYELIF